MRTLATQVRLRRLLRVFGDYAERLALEPAALGSGRAKLEELALGVREAWAADLATVPIASVRRHVNRSLVGVDAALAALGRPSADPRRLADEVQETVLPLILMLRALEEVPERQVLDWIGAPELAKSA